MDYLPEEDVRKQLRQINITYALDLNDFVDLSFIKKLATHDLGQPTKATTAARWPPNITVCMHANDERVRARARMSAPSVTAQTRTSSAAAAAAGGRIAAPPTAAIEAQQIAEAQRLSLAESLNTAHAGAGNRNGSRSLTEALKSTPAGAGGRNANSNGSEGNGGTAGTGSGGGRRPKAIAIDGWVHILGAGAAEVEGPQQQQQQQQQQQDGLASPALSTTPASTVTPSSGSGLNSPREQNGLAAPARVQNELAEPASVPAYSSIPASWAPDQVVHTHQLMYADLARTGGPPVKEAMVQLATRAGGPLMASLKAKEAWRSGVRAFARAASEGPKDLTPTMTKVEVELVRSVHGEACNAVFGVLVNGEPVHMRNYFIASRQLGLDG
ncbi:hypothetical protein DUNSADRAFT_830 [Dunaliella salina]|uniref:Uncharacterized protein n=1 Tax=Dunaliella salina TaxID=3046 RepID=A0ABQ7GXU2_DUNSA|nr:hypothetical protein DUNSADRAFT_830 [Dunaliella salina]|eukprot:KAF5839428.1 hypothetical protein DUNSADRAFT_830 [Dunaliella salina]